MSFLPTTETIMLPGGGWENIPIRGGFTPGIIDHYPEGPGETRPWDQFTVFDSEPNSWGGAINPPTNDPFMVLRLPQTRLPGQRPNEIPLNPGSLNIPNFGGTGPGPLATVLFGLGGVLAGKYLGNLLNR